MTIQPTKSNEELVVMAVIKVLCSVCERWQLRQSADNLWCANDLEGALRSTRCTEPRMIAEADLLLEVNAVQRQRPRNNGERYKVIVRQQFRRGKCRECVDEERTRGLELADGEEVQAAVDLEAIAAVPVAARLYKLVRFREVGRDELVVAKEEADADEGEDDVDSRAEPGGLFERELLGLDRLFLHVSVSPV